MPFLPGHKKSGGRKKGSANRRTADAQATAERLGVDPFEILLLFAKGDWQALGYKAGEKLVHVGNGVTITVDTIEPELRQRSAADACKYLLPTRKAIEISPTDETGPIKLMLDMGTGDESGANPGGLPPDSKNPEV